MATTAAATTASPSKILRWKMARIQRTIIKGFAQIPSGLASQARCVCSMSAIRHRFDFDAPPLLFNISSHAVFKKCCIFPRLFDHVAARSPAPRHSKCVLCAHIWYFICFSIVQIWYARNRLYHFECIIHFSFIPRARVHTNDIISFAFEVRAASSQFTYWFCDNLVATPYLLTFNATQNRIKLNYRCAVRTVHSTTQQIREWDPSFG